MNQNCKFFAHSELIFQKEAEIVKFSILSSLEWNVLIYVDQLCLAHHSVDEAS